MNELQTLRVEEPEAGIVTITINRPDKLNSLSPEVLRELLGTARSLAARDDLRVVIVTGAGRAFVAGADIEAMAGFNEEQAREFGQLGHEAMDALSALPVPVIAAVNGFALGGGLELALSCDLIYASDKAKFGLPEVKLGIIPGFGGTQRLGRVIGWHAARELVFTGDMLSADQAHNLGLVRAVYPLDSFLESVLKVARTIAARGPVAIRTAKDVMRRGMDTTLAEGNQLEVASFAGLWNSEDRNEGMAAFLQKRDAKFQGR